MSGKVVAIVLACVFLNPLSLGMIAGLIAFAVEGTPSTATAARSAMTECQSEAQTFRTAFQAFHASHNGDAPGAENGVPNALGVIGDLMHAGLITHAPKFLDGAASTSAKWQRPTGNHWAFDPATGYVVWSC